MLISGAFAVLGMVFILGTVLKSESLKESALVLGAEISATILFSALVLGFRYRKPWAWWVGLTAFGLPTIAFLGLLAMTGLKVLTSGFGDRHAVGAGGEALILLFTPVLAIAFAAPLVTLLRSRSLFRK